MTTVLKLTTLLKCLQMAGLRLWLTSSQAIAHKLAYVPALVVARPNHCLLCKTEPKTVFLQHVSKEELAVRHTSIA